MGIPIYQVDSFADRPFAGNPAAVCLLDAEADAGWMQSVASEMNLSETAFVVPAADGAFDLRWFTPAVEVDLCGHATLAAAHVLWETGKLHASEEACFDTRSGRLVCNRVQGGIEMDLPADPPALCDSPDGMAEALSQNPASCARGRYDYLVEFSTEADVRALRPDFRKLAELPARGVIATAPGDSGHDFVSRYFAPASGIDEDPVTGSAHCCMAPYWGEKLGKREMTAFQASVRGGEVGVRIDGDRVTLFGSAVTVLRGELA